ncbi:MULTISPECIES: hypothetical protein [Phenylobacterium]|uniref:Glycosyltransferase RgtA/B/C/D-like domain-containing protein n=1 Tax=Phenylobacterium koreense TaxID=266125 RepID=A0ABV2EDJ8_9CAUL
MGLAGRVMLGLAAAAAGLLALIYVNAAFGALPVYVGAESAHLISALYGPAAAKAQLGLGAPDDPAFSLIIRGLTYLTQSLMPWLRLLGGAAYVGGLLLVFQAVRRNLAPEVALGFLALALVYPYHRFAFAALPEGWCVAALGAAVLLTARTYLGQPLIHGLAAGALVAVLTLLKPQGLAVGGAFVVLAACDLAFGRRNWAVFAGRLLTLGASFLVAVNGLRLLAGGEVAAPFSFYLADHYRPLLEGAVPPAGWIAAARGLAAMISGAVLLAAVPAVTGLLRIELRWLWTRGRARFALEPQETVFLLALLCLALTILLTAVLASGGAPDRVWGRQFEALIPVLWLAAAPFIVEFEKGGGPWWRRAVATGPLIGLAGLAICLLDGAKALPRDAAMLGAFGADPIPYFAAAGAVVVAGALAILATRWPVWRVWLAVLIALAAISTTADLAWRKGQDGRRAQMAAELSAADALVSPRPGEVAVMAADPLEGRLAYLRLRARPSAVVSDNGDDRLAAADTLVMVGDGAPQGGWRVVFRGETVTIFTR